MHLFRVIALATTLVFVLVDPTSLAAQNTDPRLESLKAEALELVEDRAKLVQVIVDKLFSFGELGMQEFETQRYLTGILEDNDFEIELGVAGMPSAWTARWGSGGPLIAMGSDVDGIPQSNQKPGVAYRDPILSMAPGDTRSPATSLPPRASVDLTTSPGSSIICTGEMSASSSIGCPGTFRRTPTARPALTAPHSTSTTIHARARTRTGAR